MKARRLAQFITPPHTPNQPIQPPPPPHAYVLESTRKMASIRLQFFTLFFYLFLLVILDSIGGCGIFQPFLF
jgi:hypothetical protein